MRTKPFPWAKSDCALFDLDCSKKDLAKAAGH